MNVMAPIEDADRIDAAAKLIVAGRPNEAEPLLRAVLERDPGNADAINSYASISLARGDGARAFQILSSACTAFPNHVGLQANLAMAYVMLGRRAEAVACLERAVALAPHDLAIRIAFAQALIGVSSLDRAEAEIAAVLRVEPDNVRGLANLGVVAMANGDRGKAESLWLQVIAVDPRNADALYNLSILCASSSRPDEAVRLAERAYLATPQDLTRRVHFARCLASVGDFEAAKRHCTQILLVAPEDTAATELFARLTLLRGTVPAGLETLSYHVRKHPKDPSAILALAGGLTFVGRPSQAMTFVEQALAISPDHAFANKLRRDILLTLGRFREAWPEVATAARRPPARIVAPNGASNIDALVFGRFLSELCPLGVDVVSFAAPLTTGLLGQIAGVNLVAPSGEDEAVALQDVLALLRIDRDEIKPGAPFLRPDAARVERWRSALARFPRPWIGIDFDAYPPGLRAEALLPVARDVGAVVSFAVDPERRQLEQWPETVDAGGHIADAADLVAAMSCVDAFAGTDGLPLHVAGALGRPGVALAASGPAWYLAASGARSLWYPSLLVARQTSPGDWEAPLRGLKAKLAELTAASENGGGQK